MCDPRPDTDHPAYGQSAYSGLSASPRWHAALHADVSEAYFDQYEHDQLFHHRPPSGLEPLAGSERKYVFSSV
eukprot:6428155-Prorocentrum_lima.AAC.1